MTMDKAEIIGQIGPETEREVARRAKIMAGAAKWDLNIAIFLFAILILIIILLFQGVRVEIVAPIAVVGLAFVWLAGWRRGRRLYEHFYSEEISKLDQGLSKTIKSSVEETIAEQVQKALRDRLK